MGEVGAADVGVVVTTHNALPWIEQCLASVEGVETVVVDNDSSDDTVAFVRERFPAVTVVEQANRGLAAGWARGLEELPASRWVLILNADAWLVGDALERMVAIGDAQPGGRRRRPEAPQPRRLAAALGAGLPDAAGASRPSTTTSASSGRARSC